MSRDVIGNAPGQRDLERFKDIAGFDHQNSSVIDRSFDLAKLRAETLS